MLFTSTTADDKFLPSTWDRKTWKEILYNRFWVLLASIWHYQWVLFSCWYSSEELTLKNNERKDKAYKKNLIDNGFWKYETMECFAILAKREYHNVIGFFGKMQENLLCACCNRTEFATCISQQDRSCCTPVTMGQNLLYTSHDWHNIEKQPKKTQSIHKNSLIMSYES